MLIRFGPKMMAQTVDMPDKKEFKRSCKGSLHLKPGAVKELTEDEVKELQEKHKDVAAHMAMMPEPPKAAEKKAKAPAKAESKSKSAPAKKTEADKPAK